MDHDQSTTMKRCPYCAESIQGEAVICRYCGRNVADAPAMKPANSRNRDEKMYLQERGVRISDTRIEADGKTFAMSGITSVDVRVQEANRMGAFVLIGLGIVGLLSASASSAALQTGAFALGLLALGLLWAFLVKNKYAVRLVTSSGEVTAIKSEDKAFTDKVVSAVNQAIVDRG